ncbi:hypothetical protein G3M83_16700 [Rouxiella badensis]|uniref:hypothetical protein n=1 Tax=Rouxiella badensis TaxID=1646377 RepID=UPI0013EF50AB|nr:hypothetical protein [Rouxiella badensis]QII39212.1 hypothetical protein G3M83_16700 [Rouxiella badensis]
MALTGTLTKSGETLNDVYAVIGTTASDGLNLTGNLDVYRSRASYDDKYPAAFSIPLRVDDDRTKIQTDLLEAYAIKTFPGLESYVESSSAS